MTTETTTKIKLGVSGATIYFNTRIVADSKFPFPDGGEVIARIDGDRIIIEKPKGA